MLGSLGTPPEILDSGMLKVWELLLMSRISSTSVASLLGRLLPDFPSGNQLCDQGSGCTDTDRMATLGLPARVREALVVCFSQCPNYITLFILPVLDTQTQNRVSESTSYANLEPENGLQKTQGPSLPITKEALETQRGDCLVGKERAWATGS